MQKTILVVEDYADTRMLMKYLIQSYGYQVIEAEDGAEAVEKAREHRPDLILMDLMLPGMDGLTATEIIRSCEGFASIPIIAVTACDRNYCEKSLAAGCNEVINKPIDFDYLEPCLNHYLH